MKLNWVTSWSTYPYHLMFSIGETDEELLRNLKRRGIELTEEELANIPMGKPTQGRTLFLSGAQTIIRLKEFNNSTSDFALLMHELFHAACYLFSYIEVPLNEDTEEAWTYAFQDMTFKIMQELSKRDGHSRKRRK